MDQRVVSVKAMIDDISQDGKLTDDQTAQLLEEIMDYAESHLEYYDNVEDWSGDEEE